MDEKKLLAVLASTIQTIAHFGIVSESIVVVTLMEHEVSIEEWQVIKHHLVKEGYINNSFHLLAITKKGKDMDKEIANAIKEPCKNDNDQTAV